MKIALDLPMPPSANRYWRHTSRGVYRSSEAVAYIELLQWQAKEWDIEPLTGRVKFEAWYSIRKNRDLDNCGKVLRDALQGIAYINDNQIDEIHERRKPFKDGGSVRVEITQL